MSTLLNVSNRLVSLRSCSRLQCAHIALSSVAARRHSTLPNNPHVYYVPIPGSKSHLLTLLSSPSPTKALAIGTTTAIPPTPQSFTSNPSFTPILDSVLKKHAHQDPSVQAQAMAYAAAERGSGLGLKSDGGAGAASAGTGANTMGLPANHPANASRFRDKRSRKPGPGTASSSPSPISTSHSSPAATAAANQPFPTASGGGPTSAQGGMGGLDTKNSRGGWIHVSDLRNPPDWGRIAWPEDIFGSLEIDGDGGFVDGDGRWQNSGTYRIITNEGILGLTDFLRNKLIERLKGLEKSN